VIAKSNKPITLGFHGLTFFFIFRMSWPWCITTSFAFETVKGWGKQGSDNNIVKGYKYISAKGKTWGILVGLQSEQACSIFERGCFCTLQVDRSSSWYFLTWRSVQTFQ
jgi:hypothetical protein